MQIDDLKKYLLERRNRLAAHQNKKPTEIELKKIPVKDARPLQQSNSVGRLSKENIEALQKFKQQLVLRYSASTIRPTPMSLFISCIL